MSRQIFLKAEICIPSVKNWASQVAVLVKKLPANAREVREVGLIPGSGRSPGGVNGNPLQYSCLEDPTDGGESLAWRILWIEEPGRLQSMGLQRVQCD